MNKLEQDVKLTFVAFSIFDRVARIYTPPFYFRYRGEATRYFEQLLKNPQLPFSKNPSDFELYALADFNEQTGAFDPFEDPEYICKATDFNPEGK